MPANVVLCNCVTEMMLANVSLRGIHVDNIGDLKQNNWSLFMFEALKLRNITQKLGNYLLVFYFEIEQQSRTQEVWNNISKLHKFVTTNTNIDSKSFRAKLNMSSKNSNSSVV